MTIEFRVQGKDRDLVAEELAVRVKTMFGVEATIHKPPSAASSDEEGPVQGLLEVAVLIVHVAIVAHAVYEKYVQEPHEKAVAKWRELVFFAKEKRPTEIRAFIGKDKVVLHEGDPERLYKMTRSALDSAVVTLE
jgi:hypothetical protein